MPLITLASYAFNSDQMMTVLGRGGNIKLYCQYGTLNEITELMQTFT